MHACGAEGREGGGGLSQPPFCIWCIPYVQLDMHGWVWMHTEVDGPCIRVERVCSHAARRRGMHGMHSTVPSWMRMA